MPRFTPDMSKARATTRIFDRGEYLLKVTEAHPFIYERENDGTVVAGVRYDFEMRGKVNGDGSLSDEHEGERTASNRVYVHTEGAWGVAKSFVMAAAGYDRNQEDEFDSEWVPEHDFTLEGEPEDDESEYEVGDAWRYPVGKLVVATLDKRMYDGQPQQDFRSFGPSSRIKG